MEKFFSGFEKRAGFFDFFKKIKSHLPWGQRNATPSLKEPIKPDQPYQRKPPEYFRRNAGDKGVVKQLNHIIKLNKKTPENTISLRYRKANGDTVTRKITPYSAKGKNLLVGHDHFRGELRSFRIDRVKKITPHKKTTKL